MNGPIQRTVFLALLLLLNAMPGLAQETGPYLLVLGVVQDAGYPQAGCYAVHCMPGWEDPRLRRGATSIALVDIQGQQNFLFEATPQLPEQLYRLSTANAFPLAGIFLTHAHIGHYTGLMFLGREAMGTDGVPVYAMPRMSAFLTRNGPWSQLIELNNIVLRPISEQRPVSSGDLSVTPFLVPHRDEYSETVGYRIEGPDKSAVFIPDINKWSDWQVDIRDVVRSVDYALLDATFYADGELGNRDMSQIPHPFVTETMELFSDLDREEKNKIWFIHFNHSNPLLNEDSEESHYVRELGFNIASEAVRLPL